MPLALSAVFTAIGYLIAKHLRNIEKIADKIERLQEVVLKSEASTKIQQEILIQLLKEMASNEISNKSRFDAVFRFIDAPSRKTDN